jgi:excinuclease ABC subunit A
MIESATGVAAKRPSRPGITHITVRGARQHNLRNISVSIPRNTLTVVTGLSGSTRSTPKGSGVM